MFDRERAIRPALAGIVVLCFLLPFVEITCGGQKIAAISGVDMALGREIKPPDMSSMMGMGMKQTNDPRFESELAKPYEDTTNHDSASMSFGTTSQDGNPFSSSGTGGKGKVKPEPTAAAAFALSALALVTALGASRKLMIGSAVCAGLAAVALFVMKTRFSGDIPPEVATVIGIEWTFAFWAALVGSAALAIFTIRVLSETSTPVARPRMVIQSYSDLPPKSSVPH
jgi:lysylphosphatidylglycerol synthetase-like protein (DUF2156 family)